MRRVLLALVLLPVLTVAAPVPKSLKEGDYFPLQLGNTWVYDDGETREVTKWDARSGTATVTFRYADPELTHEKTYLMLSDYVLRARNGPREYGPSSYELRLPLRSGVTWSWIGGKLRNGTIVPDDHEAGEPEEVTVPAGRFTAIPVTFTPNVPDGKQQTRISWYAKGVGLVKFQSAYGVKELVSFTPGADTKK